ncbi:MAG TPA: methyltransferase [Longimicrobiaceae bacterium]
MPLKLREEERQKMFETNEGAAPLLDMVSAYVFRMASTALRLGVFELLREGPCSAAEAAGRLEVDERGLGLLLSGLAAGGYLDRDGELYSVNAMAEKFLLAEPGIVEMMTFYDTLLVHLWADLETSVRSGTPPRDYFRWLAEHPDTLRQFQRFLSAGARGLRDKVVELADLPETARRLLDLGGGHGIYAAAFCSRHPELHATLFDLPEALEAGREILADAGLEGRIHFQGGDLLSDDFGTGYDVVLLASVVHCLLPEDSARLLGRVRDALNPGGMVIVAEQVTEGRPDDTVLRQAFLQMFSLNLFHLMGGQLYSEETIAGWLTGSGFEPPVMKPVAGSSFTLFVARRADG